VVEAGRERPPADVKKSVGLTFDGDYNSTVLGREQFFVTVLHNHLAGRYPSVLLSDFKTREGMYLRRVRWFSDRGGSAKWGITAVDVHLGVMSLCYTRRQHAL